MIELPWPPKELNPNARIHHFAKAKATKVYRESSYWIAHEASRRLLTDTQLIALAEGNERVRLLIEFRPPDARRRDLDGMLSSIKAGLDGIADALHVNDHRFDFDIRRCEPVKGGCVTVVLEAA